MISPGQLPYYFLFALIACFAILFDFIFREIRIKNLFFCGLAIILSIFGGTRIGWPDQDAYTAIYDAIQPLSSFLSAGDFSGFRVEGLFVLANSFLKSFSNNALLMFMFFSFASVILVLNSFVKYSPFFFTAVLLYWGSHYFIWGMMQIRMEIAGALLLFGIRYLIERKWFLSLLFLAVACGFHASAIAILFGVALWLWNPSTKIILSGVLIALLIGIYMPVSNELFRWLSASANFSVIHRAVYYVNNTEQGYILGILRPSMIRSYLILSMGIFYRKKLSQKAPYFNLFFLFYFGGIIWRLIFNDLAVFSSRGGEILTIGEPVIVTAFLLLTENKRIQLCFGVIICLLVLFGFYLSSNEFFFPDYMSVLIS